MARDYEMYEKFGKAFSEEMKIDSLHQEQHINADPKLLKQRLIDEKLPVATSFVGEEEEIIEMIKDEISFNGDLLFDFKNDNSKDCLIITAENFLGAIGFKKVKGNIVDYKFSGEYVIVIKKHMDYWNCVDLHFVTAYPI